jgi:hypothetical protein
MIARWQAVEGRWKALILLGGALVILGLSGRYGSTTDLEVSKVEAVEIGSEYLDFEPEITETRILRQGFFRRPVWAVNFSIADPADPRNKTLRQLTVEVDAVTGNVLRIGDDRVDEPASS